MGWSMGTFLTDAPEDTGDLLPPRPPTRGPPEPVGFRRPPPPLDEKQQRRVVEDGMKRLKQQLRDALFARTSAQISEPRVLKRAFVAFDTDGSGQVDLKEFCAALEHLGLHIDGVGMPGRGGLQYSVVQALFESLDADSSGQVDYAEFVRSLNFDSTWRHY